MAKKELALYAQVTPKIVSGRWVKEQASVQVIVMARADGYAMVRRPKCAPFVVLEKELSPLIE